MFLFQKLMEIDDIIAAREELEMQKLRDAHMRGEISEYEAWEAIENIRARTQTRFNLALDERINRSYHLYKS